MHVKEVLTYGGSSYCYCYCYCYRMVERDSKHDQNTQGDSSPGIHNTADQDENEDGKQHDDGIDQVSEDTGTTPGRPMICDRSERPARGEQTRLHGANRRFPASSRA